MTSDFRVCLFCLDKTTEVFPTFGDSELSESARNVINKYFDVFDPEEINSSESFVCFDCWNTIKSFHELYLTVDAIYRRSPTVSASDTDKEESIDLIPVIEYDTEENDETVIGLEIDILGQSTSKNTFIDECSRHANEEGGDDEDTDDEEKEEECIDRVRKQWISDKSKERLNLRKHKKDRVVDGIVCYICHKPFRSFETLRRHLLQHNPEGYTFECYICSNMFSREYLLRNHIKYGHELREKYWERANRKTSCPICDKRLAHRRLKLHISTMHENKKLKKDDEILKCKECDEEVKGKRALRRHELSHQDEKITQVECGECGKLMKNQYILTMHKKIHDTSPQECPHCDKIKPNIRALQSHILVAHSTPKHKCTICTKSFTRPKSLREHMATHTGKSLYNCSYCAKTFRSNGNMYKHLKEYHSKRWNLDRAKRIK